MATPSTSKKTAPPNLYDYDFGAPVTFFDHVRLGLPQSTKQERLGDASKLAEDMLSLSRERTPTPEEPLAKRSLVISVKPYDLSQHMEEVTLKIEGYISSLRYISSACEHPIDHETLERFQQMIMRASHHIYAIENIKKDGLPTNLTACKELVTNLEKKLQCSL
jgi:hypothetical protein